MLTQDVPVSEDYVNEIQRYEKEIFEERFAIQRDINI
jgi:L-rhamnose isomerase